MGKLASDGVEQKNPSDKDGYCSRSCDCRNRKLKKKKKHRGADESSDDSSSSSFSSSDEISSDEEGVSSSGDGSGRRSRRKKKKSRKTSTLKTHFRKKGEAHRGLRVIRAINPLYERQLDYRYYRLKRQTSKRTGRKTGKVRDQIKRMAYSLEEYRFTGEDPIMVFDFLARFCDEADTLEMSEAQAYVALPYFFRAEAKMPSWLSRTPPVVRKEE